MTIEKIREAFQYIEGEEKLQDVLKQAVEIEKLATLQEISESLKAIRRCLARKS